MGREKTATGGENRLAEARWEPISREFAPGRPLDPEGNEALRNDFVALVRLPLHSATARYVTLQRVEFLLRIAAEVLEPMLKEHREGERGGEKDGEPEERTKETHEWDNLRVS
jgi:hypothetical protein